MICCVNIFWLHGNVLYHHNLSWREKCLITPGRAASPATWYVLSYPRSVLVAPDRVASLPLGSSCRTLDLSSDSIVDLPKKGPRLESIVERLPLNINLKTFNLKNNFQVKKFFLKELGG